MKIAIINGPNLNLLGKREPEKYGNVNFEEFFNELKVQFSSLELSYFQSNHEGKIIDYIHECGFTQNAIIINPGGLSHTSVSLADALQAVPARIIEVHITNVHKRESFRHFSYVSTVAQGVICGLGLTGYRLAIHYLQSTL